MQLAIAGGQYTILRNWDRVQSLPSMHDVREWKWLSEAWFEVKQERDRRELRKWLENEDREKSKKLKRKRN